MRRGLASMCLIGAIFAAPEVSTGATDTTGVMTVNEWRQLSEPTRFAYVIGVTESFHFLRLVDRAAPPLVLVDSPSSRLVAGLASCEGKGMIREQVVAIVDKYVNDHPAQWHWHMPELVLSALRAACSP